MHFIFNGSITDSVWQDGLDRVLLFWRTGRLPAPMSAYPCDHFDSDVLRTDFPCGRPLSKVNVPHCNPHRLQRDFLLYQAGYLPRTIRISNCNGLLGNVAVLRRPPLNSRPVAGPCLVWRGSLSGSRDGNDGGYAQYNGKALHRLMYEESRNVRLAGEDLADRSLHCRFSIRRSQ